jgi:hypothetical protein
MSLLSRVKTWIEGDTLTAADLNAEFDNVISTGLAPAYIDDDSANTVGMQTTVDPYPATTESLATTLKGEIERLRYVIKQISGEAQWYIDPDSDIATLAASVASLGSVGNPAGGINNLSLSATVSGKALTIGALTAAAATPSSGDPVTINFRSSNATGSGTFNRTITSALSVVLSSGSTLGFTAALTGRIYVWAIDNAGTVELALSRTADIFPESSLASTTAEGGAGAADGATTMYSTTARTNVPCRCIGYIEITTGATAGEWDNAPVKIQVMGPGIKRTGDIVQIKNTVLATTQSFAAATWTDITNLAITMTPTSVCNSILLRANLHIGAATANDSTFLAFAVGGSQIGLGVSSGSRVRTGAAGNIPTNTHLVTMTSEYLHSPASVSAQAYTVQGRTSASAACVNYASSDHAFSPSSISTFTAMEIMA